MNGHVEREPLIAPAGERRHQNQMTRTRDWQELGDALHDRQNHNLQPGHRLLRKASSSTFSPLDNPRHLKCSPISPGRVSFFTWPDNASCSRCDRFAKARELQIDAALQQKLCLRHETLDIRTGVGGGIHCRREIDPGRDVLNARQDQRIVVSVVAKMTAQPAIASLVCVVLLTR